MNSPLEHWICSGGPSFKSYTGFFVQIAHNRRLHSSTLNYTFFNYGKSRRKTRSVHLMFNCITVNFDQTQHGMYKLMELLKNMLLFLTSEFFSFRTWDSLRVTKSNGGMKILLPKIVMMLVVETVEVVFPFITLVS